MRTALVCAAWSGGAILAELLIGAVLVYFGGEYLARALDINT